MKLLALDTATELCSAALWLEGSVTSREAWVPREHGTVILPMIEELLREQCLAGSQLDAIAFGRGPGAFTGLRLAAAVAQGLGFAWERPVIAISDLRALAAQLLPPSAAGRVLVCQDARMEEVYWGCFERLGGVPAGLRPTREESVSAPDLVELPDAWLRPPGSDPIVLAVGSGFQAYPALSARLGPALIEVRSEGRPHAREIAMLAAAEGLGAAVPAEQALPVYLRDRVTSPSRN